MVSARGPGKRRAALCASRRSVSRRTESSGGSHENCTWRSIPLFRSYSVLLCLVSAVAFSAGRNRMELINQSGDAYVRQAGTRWLFGTSKVEKEVVLKDGHLCLD